MKCSHWNSIAKFTVSTVFILGLAYVAVNNKESLSGMTAQYLVRDQHLVIPIKFESGSKFSNGITLVQDKNIESKWIVIDKAGRQILDNQFDSVGSISVSSHYIRVHEAGQNNNEELNFCFKGRNLRKPEFKTFDGLICDGRERVLITGKNHRKVGFVTETGEWIAGGAIYDDADAFSEGMAAVKIGEKWGYINSAGKMIIPAQFNDARMFYRGYAEVSLGKSGVKVIDREGNIREKPNDNIELLRHGKSLEKNSNGKFGLRNIQGRWLIEPKYDEIDVPVQANIGAMYTNGAWVRLGQQWGWLNNQGKVSIPLQKLKNQSSVYSQFPGYLSISGGVAVRSGGRLISVPKVPKDEQIAILDRNGNDIVGFAFTEVLAYYEGLNSGNCRTGENQLIYDDASIVVGAGSPQQYGYVFLDNRKIIPPAFSRARPFTEGIGAVYTNPASLSFLSALFPRKCGFIDQSGRFLIEPKFDECYPSSDGMAMVKVGNRIGYIRNPFKLN
jgi:WG containing repeat